MFIAGLGWGGAALLIPLYGDSLGAGLTLVGFLWTVYSLPRSVFNPLFGRLSDHLGSRKNLVSFGLVASGILFLFIPIAGLLTAFLALRGMQGIALSAVRPVTTSLVSGEKKSKGRGQAMGYYDGVRTIGQSLSPILIGFLLQYYGFIPSFAISGFFNILAGILFFFTVSEEYGPPHREPINWKETTKRVLESSLNTAWTKLKVSIYATVRSPIFPVLVLILLRFIGRHAYSRFIPIYLKDLGFAESWIGLLRSFRTGSTAIIMVGTGAVADRIGRRPLVLLAVFSAALEPFLLYWKPNLYQAFIIFFLGSFGWGAFIPAVRAMIGDLAKGKNRGGAYGSLGAAMLLGISIGPVIGGQISDHFSLRLNLLLSSGFLILILFLFFVLLKETLASKLTEKEVSTSNDKS